MKFEKRTDGEQIPSSPQEDKPSAGRKPVVIYIMILFIVAFLLMALSFVMHQRSNTEVLGELQDSVSAMQEIQSTQDALLDLQDQLETLKTENVSLTARHEQMFDLATVKETAEAAGMTKPSGSQIYYIDLSRGDSAVVYQQKETSVLSRLLTSLNHGFYAVVEYFD